MIKQYEKYINNMALGYILPLIIYKKKKKKNVCVYIYNFSNTVWSLYYGFW
jgi:hypothetical protein